MCTLLRLIAVLSLGGLLQALPSSGSAAWVDTVSPQLIVHSGSSISEIGSVPDGAGGVIVIYQTYSAVTGRDIAARRYNTAGELAWGVGTLSVCSAPGDQVDIFVVPTGTGGCFVMWTDFRDSQADVYVQKINSAGQISFSPDGSPYISGTAAQSLQYAIGDGFDGFVLLYRAGILIEARRYNSLGQNVWASAATVSDTSGDEISHVIADGTGGFYAGLERVGVQSEVVIQPVSSTGVADFDQLLSLNSNGNQYGIKMALRPNGNVLAVWFDGGVTPSRLVANEFVDPLVFNPNMPLQTGALDVQAEFELIGSSFGDPIILYGDIAAADGDTYVGRISSAGALTTYVNMPHFQSTGSHSPDNLVETPSGKIRVTFEESAGSARLLAAAQFGSAGVFEWTRGVTPYTSSFKTTEKAALIHGSQDSLIVFNSQIVVPQPITFALARVRADGTLGGEVFGPDLQQAPGTLTSLRKNRKLTLVGDIIIRNDGSAPSAPSTVAFNARNSPSPLLSTEVPLFELPVPSLQSGEQFVITPGQLPPKKPGKKPKNRKIKLPKDAKTVPYYLVIKIDPANTIIELDETDNELVSGPL